MRHLAGLGASAACALMLVACGGGDRAAEQTGQTANANAEADNPLLNSDVRPQTVNASGCLTSANGRYVVTALDEAGTVPTTVTYQLAGGDQADLQKHVNREVRIAGEADPAQVADVRDVGTPSVGTTGERSQPPATGAGQPEVKTQQSMRFEVRTVRVSSITATGNECPAGATQNR